MAESEISESTQKRLDQLADGRQKRLDKMAVEKLAATTGRVPVPTSGSPKVAAEAMALYADATTAYLSLVARRADLARELVTCDSEIVTAERVMNAVHQRLDGALAGVGKAAESADARAPGIVRPDD